MAENRKISLKGNVVLNFIKAFSGILFPMIIFKYATNVLSTEKLGTINFCSSIIGYFSLLAGLGISSYAVREGAGKRNSKAEINDFSSQVFSINCVSCVISLALLFIGIYCFKGQQYAVILLIQSFIIIFTTLGTEWINIIYEDFLYITLRTVSVQIVSLILLFNFVKTNEDYIIYTVITVASQVGAYILNILHVRKFVSLRFRINFNWKKHLKPIFVIFFSTVAVTIYATIDVTMIGIFCNKSDVAIYTAATKIYSALKSIFATLLAVIMPRLSFLYANNRNNYNDLLTKVLRYILILLIPCTILSNVLCNDLILLISGEEYLTSNKSLHTLSIAIIFSAVSCFIVNNIFLITKKEKYSLIATVAGALIDFILNLFIIKKYSYSGAAVTTLISEAAVCAICMYFSKGSEVYSRLFNKKNIKFVLIDIFAGGVMLAICMLINTFEFGYIVRIMLSAIAGGAGFVLILLLFKHELIWSEYKKLISKFKRIIKRLINI